MLPETLRLLKMGDIFHRKGGGVWEIFKIVGHTTGANNLGFQAESLNKRPYVGKVDDRRKIIPDRIWKNLYL